MIRPTVGRVVWYYNHPPGDGDKPLAAVIARVHSDELVTLMVIDSTGIPFSLRDVPLRQDDSTDWGDRPYCTWMPYQKGQAVAEAARKGYGSGAAP